MKFLLNLQVLGLLACCFCAHFAQSQAPTPKGKISGKIIDRKTGETLIGVAIKVEELNKGAVTDIDGKYLITLETGTYTLAVSYLGYETQKFSNIVVAAGQVINVDAGLKESKAIASTKDVVITKIVKRGSVDLLLLDQKTSNAVSSGISSELIKRTPDRTAADVLKRISGTSIQDNKFAVVRGLGDRYNSGMMNGAPIPSTEPDRKAFNLELVPAPMIESIVINKSATPDQPGDFGGGLVQISTKDIPFSNTYYIQLGAGTNSITTNQTYYNDKSSPTDNLGYDNGLRRLPTDLASRESLDKYAQENGIGASKNKAYLDNTLKFQNNNSIYRSNAMPNTTFQLGAGWRIPTGKNDLGIVAALSYNKSLRYIPIASRTFEGNVTTDSGRRTANKTNFDFGNFKTTINIGAVLNVSYRLGNSTKISFKNFLSQSSEDVTSLVNGYSNSNYSSVNNRFTDSIVQKNRLFFYASTRLYSGQLNFEHTDSATKIKVKVTTSLNNLYRTTPDFRKLLYSYTYQDGENFYNPRARTNGFVLNEGADSPNITTISNKYFSDMNENGGTVNASAEIPFALDTMNGEPQKMLLKVGVLYQNRGRTYSGRNFVYSIDKDLSTRSLITFSQKDPDEIFSVQNGTYKYLDTNKIFLKEGTRDYDDYNAGSTTKSAFAMLDLRLSQLHFIYGARVESFNMRLNSSNSGMPVAINTIVTDILPSINATYEITKELNLRGSVSKTVSRPEFREVAPLVFFDVNYNSISVGNPDLRRALITNYDLKLEYYPTDGETFSINPFLKNFQNPIEQFNEVAGGYRRLSFRNATSAQNYGLELEARMSLGRITESLSDFTVYSNYAWIKSTVNLSDSIGKGLSVNGDRPLQGQSPYVFNAGIQYSNQKTGINALLTLNRIGRRIIFISQAAQEHVWENPRTVLDFSLGKTFFKKLQARIVLGDILHQNLVYYQDINQNNKLDDEDIRAFTFKYGFTTSFSINYTF